MSTTSVEERGTPKYVRYVSKYKEEFGPEKEGKRGF